MGTTIISKFIIITLVFTSSLISSENQVSFPKERITSPEGVALLSSGKTRNKTKKLLENKPTSAVFQELLAFLSYDIAMLVVHYLSDRFEFEKAIACNTGTAEELLVRPVGLNQILIAVPLGTYLPGPLFEKEPETPWLKLALPTENRIFLIYLTNVQSIRPSKLVCTRKKFLS